MMDLDGFLDAWSELSKGDQDYFASCIMVAGPLRDSDDLSQAIEDFRAERDGR